MGFKNRCYNANDNLSIFYKRLIVNVLECALVECLSRVRELAGSISDQVIQKTLKMVVIAFTPWRSELWRRDETTSSTANLPKKRRDKTVKLLKAA